MKEYGLVIDGRSIATERHKPVTSPSTGTVVGLSPLASPANLDEAVAAAKRAFPARAATRCSERAALCTKLAETMEAHAEEFAISSPSNRASR